MDGICLVSVCFNFLLSLCASICYASLELLFFASSLLEEVDETCATRRRGPFCSARLSCSTDAINRSDRAGIKAGPSLDSEGGNR